ncbi:MAG: MotA/TolQ/ExbB proton channel family protein [Candidatus Wallacebacter cryptica]|nr:MotA/TolQ/ExbB proton channel family protein [Bacillota bacterium]
MVNIIISGGPVMIPLLLCSVVAVAVGLERLWYLLRSRVDTEDLMEDIELALGQGKVLEAMQLARKSRGPVAAILSAGIAFYDRDKAEIKERMHEIGNAEIYKMEKRMNILNVIISIAPMLGLLGTVTGVIDAFNVMGAMQGIHQPSDLSSGIAEALITTAAGLIIAVPTMAVTAYLNSIIERNIAEMSRCSTQLLDILGVRGDDNGV